MPRQVRIEYEGALYHVMARGNRRERIFASSDGADEQIFLRSLGECCARTGFRVWSWVLMGNHYHLLLETPSAKLVAGMGNVSVHERNLSARPEKGLPREVRTWMRRFR